MDHICVTCLSISRRLFLLENLNIAWFGFEFPESSKVCWECKSILQRIQAFRLQAMKAQLYLGNYDKNQQVDLFVSCLSNLAVYHKDSYDSLYLHEDVVKSEDLDVKEDPDDEDFVDFTDTPVESVPADPAKPVEILFTVPGPSADAEDVTPTSPSDKKEKREKKDKREKKERKVKRVESKVNREERRVKEKEKEATIHQIMTFSEEEMQQARDQRKSAKRFLKAQYKCESCIIEFTMIRTYNKHMRTKHSEKQGKFACKICAQRFKKQPDVREHFLEHYRYYRCRECDFSHHKLNIVEAHYEANHETERVYPCLKCEEKFLTRRKRKAHVQTAHGEAATCHVCHKIFPNSLRLKRHLVSHADLPKMECQICHKVYNGAQNLASHMKRHEARERDPPEDAYCAECDVRFKNRTRLNWHLKYSRRHANEERLRYQCDECGKKFGRRFQIENHIDRDHVKILKYPCDQCDQKFLSSLQRRYHVQRFHEMRVAVKKRTTCKICGKEFASVATCRIHQRVHTGDRPYHCRLCPMRFSQSSSLKTHVRGKHKEGAPAYPPKYSPTW